MDGWMDGWMDNQGTILTSGSYSGPVKSSPPFSPRMFIFPPVIQGEGIRALTAPQGTGKAVLAFPSPSSPRPRAHSHPTAEMGEEWGSAADWLVFDIVCQGWIVTALKAAATVWCGPAQPAPQQQFKCKFL